MDEILHQLIGSLSHYLQGFLHPTWGRISSINSKPLLSHTCAVAFSMLVSNFLSDILLDTEEVRLQQAFQGSPSNDEGEKVEHILVMPF